MFNKLFSKSTSVEENAKKDFKKLANYVIMAKGSHRTINSFSADCRTNADYIADVINAKISSYPTIPFLKLIADNSEGRVSLKDLTLACGYSNYANNDMEQIKNINVRRGWICYANFGDKAMDSEIGGHRPVLVVQNNVGNKFSSNSIVLPITSRNKASLPTQVFIKKELGLQCDSIISCEMPNTISKRRMISKTGIIEKIAECPYHIMEQVEVCLLRAQGIIDLKMDMQEAISYLANMNKVKTYQFQNNYNHSSSPQVACSM